jgi:hypothetical protein
MRIRRRHFLGSALALGGGITLPFAFGERFAHAQGVERRPADRLLFVICAAGGGAISESFLPVAHTEVSSPALASTLAVQPPSLMADIAGTTLRCVKNRGGTVAELPAGNAISQELFLQRHGTDTAVLTLEGTSVNHRVAQKRSLTGAGIDRGRTILEAVAARHGSGLLLPNVNMAPDGYLDHGDDDSVPLFARTEPVRDAKLFAFQTDGTRGQADARMRTLVARARAVRDDVDERSAFGHTFAGSPLRQRYLERRRDIARLEAGNLVEELMFVPDDPARYPLSQFGLARSTVADRVLENFPNLDTDPLEAQGALAFLLARAGTTAAVAISPSFQPEFKGASIVNTPIAFDFSHADHPGTQNVMWSRVLAVADGLIRLLKSEPVSLTDASQGTLFDRSLVYIATDFGRDKVKPAHASSWGTGHHLNNGHVLISPLLKGGRAFGGIDPDTLLTYGFDTTTGAALPGTVMREGHIYSTIAQALDVDFEGRFDMTGVVR